MATSITINAPSGNVSGLVNCDVVLGNTPPSDVLMVKAVFLYEADMPSDPNVVSTNTYVANLNRDPSNPNRWTGTANVHGLTGANLRFRAWPIITKVDGSGTVNVNGQGGGGP